ncbi:type I inositol 1,4,5-trisphosphate 5-phosphatase-like [Limulus polyphemus]|uniref:inositol-polyphosphate 5-phosphatase n=1 Tax=Limulus polyphemus TaxID=6850 RepID=A0ABM1B4V2_LIMPO|nr:type I inositol 1,4,5-trisphosphate 5-phosphatase-like [Limulus polyphemus]
MEEGLIPMMLVTANVGSIFEDPNNLLKLWVKEFLLTVKRFQPKFLALHCQEVGGKNYEESMRHVEDFVRTLMASEELMAYDQVRVFLDEDFTCTEKFTALGNLYFIHNSLKNVQIWDFHDHTFIPFVGKEVHSGNIEKVPTKEKDKFPQDFFPECKWSRKGFMRTRWCVNGTVFDLINIHLFHDASNFISMETFPSSYSQNRQRALEQTLKRFHSDDYDKVPFIMFGDFNFRLDTKAVIQRLTERVTPIHIKNSKNGEVVKMLYRDPVNENRVVLTLEKKVFDLENHEETFFKNNGKWLREFDKEMEAFQDRLFEFDINFPPSYPFREDMQGATSYMRTRCPSWCDRVLLNRSAQALIHNPVGDDKRSPVTYQLIGTNVSMGDHKPVLLWFQLQPSPENERSNDHLPSQVPLLDTSRFGLPRVGLTMSPGPDSGTVTRYIHVKYPGSPVQIFRETTV